MVSGIKKCEVCSDIMVRYKLTNEYGDEAFVWVCRNCDRKVPEKRGEMKPQELK